MSGLNTPYEIGKTSVTNIQSLVDVNGMWVFDCYTVDAGEILKRLNGYEEIVTENIRLMTGGTLPAKNKRIAELEQQTLELQAKYNSSQVSLKAAVSRHEEALRESSRNAKKAAKYKYQVGDLIAGYERMREALGSLTTWTHNLLPDDEFREIKEYWLNAKDVLAETPKQSLTEIQAKAVEDAAKAVFNQFNKWGKAQIFLNEYANQLRNQVKGSGS